VTTVQTVVSVVGARPNFMKAAPIIAELNRRREDFTSIVVHTGQHYDSAMSEVFFEELGIGAPDYLLGVGPGTQAEQTARVMKRVERVLLELSPDVVLVPGDVNSTLGASLAAVKLGIPIGHVEAGLRSFDRTMPEEINRVVTDTVSNLLFVHSPEAIENLIREGADPRTIHMVGNTMIDTLVATLPRIETLGLPRRLGLDPGAYLVVTLHRPSLVDGPMLGSALDALNQVAVELPVVFPVHPRTRARLESSERSGSNGLRLLDPLGYLEFMSLVCGAAGVITDSGGIQEETTFLRIPCFTLRANTERPITCSVGTNMLLGLSPERIRDVPRLLEEARTRSTGVPDLWDGEASRRIVDVLARESIGDSTTRSPGR
jgi:UDP-N-acetylglucosamine 2-epimerase (non-hydrolysing)